MEIKITSAEVIKEGISAKTGKPWKLVKCAVEGKTGLFTGFAYESVPKAGDVINVELYQEEYQGVMQDKFKIIGKSPAAKAASLDNERLRRMEGILVNINEHVMRLYKHAGIDKTPDYPEYKGPPVFDLDKNKEDEITPDDIPF